MKVDELIEIAVANADERRVEVVALEPAEIATEGVSGLAQLIAELVDNAVSFSEPGEVARVTGLFDGDDYLVTVSDTGVGVSEHFLNALNRALEDPKVHIGGPEPRLGIQLVARLAGRLGIDVRLDSGMPGTHARARVPARLVHRVETKKRHEPEKPVFAEAVSPVKEMALAGVPRTISAGVGRTIDLTRYESQPPVQVGEPAPAETTPVDVEEFLERVFAPLAGGSVVVESPNEEPADEPMTPSPSPEARPTRRLSGTTLRVRVPGENFSLPEDEPSTAAGEGAVDIRKALSSYDSGRQSATGEPTDDES
jgi:hypothetical protein